MDAEKLSRRTFIKKSGIAVASGALLSGLVQAATGTYQWCSDDSQAVIHVIETCLWKGAADGYTLDGWYCTVKCDGSNYSAWCDRQLHATGSPTNPHRKPVYAKIWCNDITLAPPPI
jgi:hypothetical protein